MQSFELKGQQLLLLGEKAIFWKEENSLLIADAHLGKVTHFRKAGIAVPDKAALQNLRRLERLINELHPEKVIFLGDLFHSEMNTEWLLFKEFLSKYQNIDFQLVQGNHDILHELSYSNSHFTLFKEPIQMGPFTLSHEPLENSEGYNLCGHIHPGVRMSGLARQSLRFPCFFFGDHCGILPAFGEFTGIHLLKPKSSDTIFIINKNDVIRAA